MVTCLQELTIADVHDQLLNGTFTCAELVQAYLQVFLTHRVNQLPQSFSVART